MFEPQIKSDSEIKRVLVINAHPDDQDFGAGGTIASWTSKGIKVSYVVCTNGDQGGVDPSVDRATMPAIRQAEQRAAGAALGVEEITFLNYVDGSLAPTLELRKKLVREIRRHRPDRLLIQSPERNWQRIPSSHPDHMAAGEAAIQAVYPDAGNPFAFTDLISEGFEPWTVEETWVMGHHQPNHHVDITDFFTAKIAAIKAHESQTGHQSEIANYIREWGVRNAADSNLAIGRLAERFLVIKTG